MLVGPIELSNCDSPFVISVFAELDFDICESIDWVMPVLTVSKLPGPEATVVTLNFAVLESTGDGTTRIVPLDLTRSEFAELIMSDATDVSLVIDLAGNRVEAPPKGLVVALDPMGTGIIGFGASDWIVDARAELDPEEPVELAANGSGDVAIDCGSVDEVADNSDVGAKLIPEGECIDVTTVKLDLNGVDTKATVSEVLVVGNASLGDIKLVNVGLVVVGALGIVVFEASEGVRVGPEILIEVPGLCGLLSGSVAKSGVAELVVEVSEPFVLLNNSVVDCNAAEPVVESAIAFDVGLLVVATITGSGVVELVVEGVTGSGVVELVVEIVTGSGDEELVVEGMAGSGVVGLVVEGVTGSGIEELDVEGTTKGGVETVVEGATGGAVAEIVEVRLNVVGVVVGVVSGTV